MSNKYTEVDQFLTDLFELQDSQLSAVLASIEAHQLDPHSISPVQARILTQYAKLTKAKIIVEIGTLAGYSAIVLARALQDGGQLFTIDPDPRCCAIARANIEQAGLTDRIQVIEGQGVDILQNALDDLQSVDLFFMDGDKEHYVEYYEWAVPRMTNGKLIIADNVLRDGRVLEQQSIDPKVLGVQRYLQHLAADKRTLTSVMATEGEKGYDGMAVSFVL